jgi:hypothetical protein
MKKREYLSPFLLIGMIVGLSLVSCKKDSNTSPERNQQMIINEINKYSPDVDVITKVKMVEKFKTDFAVYTMKKSYKDDIIFENKPANQARWEIETTLNNCYANVFDTTGFLLQKDTVEFIISNAGFDSNGEPIVDGISLMSAYDEIKNIVEGLNSSETPFYLTAIKVESYTDAETKYSAEVGSKLDYIIYDPSWIYIIRPWENPIPFAQGTSMKAVGYADLAIQLKLNTHFPIINPYLQSGKYFIEYPEPIFASRHDGNGGNGYPNMWYGTSFATVLYTGQLNYYLEMYKDILDEHIATEGGWGYNNLYYSHVYVYTAYIANPPDGFNYWHVMEFHRVIITPYQNPG